MAIALIKMAVKNPEHAAALKTELINLRDAINAAYPGA